MSSLVPVLYYGGFTILFFFWIYGIVSFALDVKNKIIPGLRAYRRGRNEHPPEQQSDQPEDREGLY
ncbi:hypothetical protein HLRTI_001067 [Halorhabdus tiamatea SARL4B]|uniref:Uncharacterized protein n=1 Tax=Halorhabdus tiamatea SARL4B TaxID=1033806 RepID=F7PJ79_9EURY|nr:hypothetical protein [Halorhabdus tiamatea]ERJ06813.1 hypothetical protein HLRTI_001067 [Halorhabdus tiamatea SARL4B]CCQ33048.1 conserved hypothetical protein [Halorhabdus tiamatea SARL4B]